MPRTGKASDGSPQGLDVAVVQRVARILGRKVDFHWCANAECGWSCLPAGRCDMVVGQPLEFRAAASAAPGAFRTPVPSLDWWFRASRTAFVPWPTSAANASGSWRALWPSPKTTMSSSASSRAKRCWMDSRTGALDAAFVDADFAAWYLHGHPRLELKLVTDYVPRERWNMAMAVRARDTQLLVEINRALAQLAEIGRMRKIYAESPCHFVPRSRRRPARKASPSTWQRIRESGRAGRQHGPRQFTLLGCEG